MEKKYVLTNDVIDVDGRTLHRIKALKTFGNISAGTLGGFIESEKNLAHDGNAWVYGDANVFGDARVFGNAWVFGDARVCKPSDIASVEGFGSEFRATSFFRCADGLIRCRCGCFYGTIDEFRSKVRETHGDSKYAKEYLIIADLMELHFKED